MKTTKQIFWSFVFALVWLIATFRRYVNGVLKRPLNLPECFFLFGMLLFGFWLGVMLGFTIFEWLGAPSFN